MSSLYSTPTFELFRRGLSVQTVKRFHGLNAYKSIADVGPDWAQALLNVIVGQDGALHKFRVPQLYKQVPGIATGPTTFFDFQQQSGTRQIFAAAGNDVYAFDLNTLATKLALASPLYAGTWSMVSAQNVLYGVNGIIARKWDGKNWFQTGTAAAIIATNANAIVGNLSPQFGYIYTYAWKNSGAQNSPVNVGTAAPYSAPTGAQNNKAFQLAAGPVPLDPVTGNIDTQIDTIVWFRSIDGGGTPYRLAEVNINTGNVTFNAGTFQPVLNGGFYTGGIDNTPDGSLDELTQAPLVNNPPIVGKFVCYGQGRVAIINLVGAPSDVIYSGFETILIGNPLECYPPSNRFRLAAGADAAAGGGIIQAGLVVFSQTGNMYMLRGQMEDITTTQPVVFTQYLEELPWKLGCFSHFTIASSPHGLIWLAADKTVHVFDGYNPPQDISYAVYPILRSITPGTEGMASGAYFNWLDRDWYGLSIATNGSLTNNTVLFWGFNAQTEDIDVFVTSLQANFITVVESPQLQRNLMVASQGGIYIVPVSDTVGGITEDLTIAPATNSVLPAFWRSCYFGNDTPYREKMWRWGRCVTDQPSSAYKIAPYYVNDNFLNPEYVGTIKLTSSRFSLNRRRKRVAVEIQFPIQDVASNVVELQVASIPSSDR